MAAQIIRGIRRPDELQEMAETGRDIVLSRYDWGQIAERLDEVWWTVATAETAVQMG
jgi:hypothetical protein